MIRYNHFRCLFHPEIRDLRRRLLGANASYIDNTGASASKRQENGGCSNPCSAVRRASASAAIAHGSPRTTAAAFDSILRSVMLYNAVVMSSDSLVSPTPPTGRSRGRRGWTQNRARPLPPHPRSRHTCWLPARTNTRPRQAVV